jgi:hypothetical protein
MALRATSDDENVPGALSEPRTPVSGSSDRTVPVYRTFNS